MTHPGLSVVWSVKNAHFLFYRLGKLLIIGVYGEVMTRRDRLGVGGGLGMARLMCQPYSSLSCIRRTRSGTDLPLPADTCRWPSNGAPAVPAVSVPRVPPAARLF